MPNGGSVRSESARSRYKCPATITVVEVVVTGMDEIEQQYMAVVERIRRHPMPAAARAAILTEIEAIYRRERAEREAAG